MLLEADDADPIDDESRDFKADAAVYDFVTQGERLLHLWVYPLHAIYLDIVGSNRSARMGPMGIGVSMAASSSWR